MVRLFLCVAAVVPLATPQAHAQNATSTPWVTDTITSATLGTQRSILVAIADGYRASGDSLPVLVLLDADDRPQFQAAVANVNFLASRFEIPGLIVVGITNGKDRTHDMTPPATGSTATRFPTAGGADAFEQFIAGEVLPYVRGKYHARHQTILAGHSFGGLFGLDIAAKGTNPYMGIIAMSPSLWWNDTTVVARYADAIAKLTTGQRMFVTSGAFEPGIDRPARRFVARLDSLQPRGVSYAYHGYSDATHGLTPQPSLIAGLRFVFEPISVARLPTSRMSFDSDSASIVQAVTAAETEYARGARSLSLPETLPEPLVNGLGYATLQLLKLPNVAAWIFKQNVDGYPSSANAYDSYGDGLAAAGDTAGAIAQYKRAVQLWEAQHDTLAAMSRGKMMQLEKAAHGSAKRSF